MAQLVGFFLKFFLFIQMSKSSKEMIELLQICMRRGNFERLEHGGLRTQASASISAAASAANARQNENENVQRGRSQSHCSILPACVTCTRRDRWTLATSPVGSLTGSCARGHAALGVSLSAAASAASSRENENGWTNVGCVSLGTKPAQALLFH